MSAGRWRGSAGPPVWSSRVWRRGADQGGEPRPRSPRGAGTASEPIPRGPPGEPAPSADDIEQLERFEPSEEPKRREPSEVDAMGQDKRRQVVGHSYGPRLAGRSCSSPRWPRWSSSSWGAGSAWSALRQAAHPLQGQRAVVEGRRQSGPGNPAERQAGVTGGPLWRARQPVPDTAAESLRPALQRERLPDHAGLSRPVAPRWRRPYARPSRAPLDPR